MAAIGACATSKTAPKTTRLVMSTGSMDLDMLACIVADAFANAERGDEEARQYLIGLFDETQLKALYRGGLISWSPDYETR